MKKKFLTISLVSLFSVALLAGCGTSGAGEGETIKVGGNFELTGGVATFGQSSVNAINLAFEQKNAQGGVLGKQLEFITADNKSEAGESTAAATKLITQDKVVAVLGAVASSNTLAAVPVATDNQVPMISPTSTNTKVTVDESGNKRDWVFRACFIDPFQGEVAANFALDTLNVKTASILIDQKSDYSKGLADAFEKSFTAGGGKVISKEQYVAGSDKDFRATLTRINADNPEVVFVPGYYQEVGLIVKQGRELGMTQPFLGGDGWDSPKLVEIAGAEALNNTYFVNHVATDDPALADFSKAYEEKYGAKPDALAALGYDAANMLIKAFEDAGSTEPAKVRDALENMKGFQGVSGQIDVDPATHNPIKSAVVIEMKDGKQTFMTKVDPK